MLLSDFLDYIVSEKRFLKKLIGDDILEYRFLAIAI